MLDVRRLDGASAKELMTTNSTDSKVRSDRLSVLQRMLIVLGAIAAPFALVLAVMQVGFFLRGGFGPRMDFEQVSPDRRHVVRVFHREPFPCTEILNPPATVTCEVADIVTEQILDSHVFRVYEESCLYRPGAVWTTDVVRITDVSTCGDSFVRLSRVVDDDPAPN